MMDLAYVVGSVVFFAVMILYVAGCERLGRTPEADRVQENSNDK